MADFQKARTNMVDGQIYTAGVILPGLLEAFETVPREKFVPTDLQNVAYGDEEIAIGKGRYLLEPVVHARMIEALELKPDQVVLDIGGGTGYSAAILSSLVSTVVALEEDENLIEHAARLWSDLGACNVVGVQGRLNEGNPENKPYDSIIINGAVEQVPEQILSQMSNGGRLVAIVKKAGDVLGEAVLFQKTDEGTIASRRLFSAGTPYLAGFEPSPSFSF